MQGIGAHMIAIATAQELRANLGDITVSGRTCSAVDRLQHQQHSNSTLSNPNCKRLMETVGPNGEILDHFDGRTLNPGHAIECAWFLMHEGQTRS